MSARINLGDLVYKTESDWVRHNPWMLTGESKIRKELFNDNPVYAGVVIEEVDPVTGQVKILNSFGKIEEVHETMLEVKG